MSKKKDLDLLVKRIKAATGLNQDKIAKSIRYSRAHFSTLKSSNSEELYDLLEAHFRDALENRNLLEETQVQYQLPDDDLYEERAMLQVLMLEMAKIKSKLSGISVGNAIDELQQNTKLALRQMKIDES